MQNWIKSNTSLVIFLAVVGLIALGFLIGSVLIAIAAKMLGLVVFLIGVLLVLWINRIVRKRGRSYEDS